MYTLNKQILFEYFKSIDYSGELYYFKYFK